ncbi:hypothetical protein [Ammoniphilus sp. 3BR4]|uniref:hypothetical protein n=1 Tax=Ammoniphilus sp. 3BR4 TaxID=3158265 RepID=UPI0034663819
MEQKSFDQLIHNHEALSRDQLIDILSYIEEKIENQDSAMMGLSNPRLLANFQAFAQISLNLLKDHPTQDITQWVKEAAYGIDSISRRELQSD